MNSNRDIVLLVMTTKQHGLTTVITHDTGNWQSRCWSN